MTIRSTGSSPVRPTIPLKTRQKLHREIRRCDMMIGTYDNQIRHCWDQGRESELMRRSEKWDKRRKLARLQLKGYA